MEKGDEEKELFSYQRNDFLSTWKTRPFFDRYFNRALFPACKRVLLPCCGILNSAFVGNH